jgi:galactosamine-6-phosphate isomerase
MLKPQVFADHEAVSRHAADRIVDRLREEPAALLCLACGTTPVRTYQLLAEHGAREPSLFAKCHVIKLDEWGGLPPEDPATCEAQLRSNLIEPLCLHERYVSFNSHPQDSKAECARVANWLLQHGPIDTCVLGLGMNGHIGFNEPAAFLEPHAHVAQISQSSLEHTMLHQTTHRPTYGLTLGMADLLQSRQVLLLVTGSTKRESLRRLLSGPITTEFPGSLLQLHPNAVILCDTTANPTEISMGSD